MSDRPGLPPSATEFVPTAAANLLPLVGVLTLGWDADTLTFVYAVELVVAILFAVPKSLVAQQPPAYDPDGTSDDDAYTWSSRTPAPKHEASALERRVGSLAVAEWLPPVYPRSVPFLSTWLDAVVFLTLVLSGFLIATLDPLVLLADRTVLVSVGSLVASHGVAFVGGYLRRRRYETATPKSVAAVPLQDASVVAAVVVVGAQLATADLLAVVVLVKLLVEWERFRGDDGVFGWFADTDDHDGPTAATLLDTDPSTELPETEPSVTVRPDRRAVVATGLLRAANRLLVRIPLLAFVWIVSVGAWELPWAGVTVAVFGLAPLVWCTLWTVEYTLTHGWMVYRRYGDTVVASDELVDAVQWTAPVGAFRDVTLRDKHLADRVYDTRTIALTPTAADHEWVAAHLLAAADAVDAFELPLADTTVDPLDRRVVWTTVCLVALVAVAVGLGVFVVPIGSGPRLALVTFGVPFALLSLQVVWDRAYSG